MIIISFCRYILGRVCSVTCGPSAHMMSITAAPPLAPLQGRGVGGDGGAWGVQTWWVQLLLGVLQDKVLPEITATPRTSWGRVDPTAQRVLVSTGGKRL